MQEAVLVSGVREDSVRKDHTSLRRDDGNLDLGRENEYISDSFRW